MRSPLREGRQEQASKDGLLEQRRAHAREYNQRRNVQQGSPDADAEYQLRHRVFHLQSKAADPIIHSASCLCCCAEPLSDKMRSLQEVAGAMAHSLSDDGVTQPKSLIKTAATKTNAPVSGVHA